MTIMLTVGERREPGEVEEELRDTDRGFARRLTLVQGSASPARERPRPDGHGPGMSTAGTADGWVRACPLAALGEDEPVHADIGQCPVCLVRTGGAVYALRDECTHQAVALSDGEVAGGAIECCLHGSRFDLATGRALSAPATRPVTVFAVRVDDGDILVRLGTDGEGDPGRMPG